MWKITSMMIMTLLLMSLILIPQVESAGGGCRKYYQLCTQDCEVSTLRTQTSVMTNFKNKMGVSKN